MVEDPTVFVVDDDEAAAASVAALMMSLGRKVETYNSAETFLAAYDEGRTGCLVLDVRLPGMSGFELQQTLATNGVGIPIIMISGHAGWRSDESTVPIGAITFLEKPYTAEKLCDAIQNALAQL